MIKINKRYRESMIEGTGVKLAVYNHWTGME